MLKLMGTVAFFAAMTFVFGSRFAKAVLGAIVVLFAVLATWMIVRGAGSWGILMAIIALPWIGAGLGGLAVGVGMRKIAGIDPKASASDFLPPHLKP